MPSPMMSRKRSAVVAEMNCPQAPAMIPASPAHEAMMLRSGQKAVMKATRPRTRVTAVREFSTGCAFPSVFRKERGLCRTACAMRAPPDSKRRGFYAPVKPDVPRLRGPGGGFQPEAARRVLCNVCTVAGPAKPAGLRLGRLGIRPDGAERITTLLPRNDRGR